MTPRIKFGLIVGAIGLILNVCVSTLMGFCGPFASLIAGGVAGYLAAQKEKLPSKGEGAKAGAIAGGITGGLMLFGQIIGGIATLIYTQTTGTSLFGTPPAFGDSSGTATYYVMGIVTACCFGLVGVALAAGAGAGAGYMTTTEGVSYTPPPSAPSMNNPL